MFKLMGRALLSVVMEKEAREKLDAMRAVKKAQAQVEAEAQRTADGAQALAEAGDGALNQRPNLRDGEPAHFRNLPPVPGGELPLQPEEKQDRQALIEKALLVHNVKSKELDRLPPQHKAALQALAMKAFFNKDVDS